MDIPEIYRNRISFSCHIVMDFIDKLSITLDFPSNLISLDSISLLILSSLISVRFFVDGKS